MSDFFENPQQPQPPIQQPSQPSRITDDLFTVHDPKVVFNLALIACDKKINRYKKLMVTLTRKVRTMGDKRDEYVNIKERLIEIQQKTRRSGRMQPEDIDYWREKKKELGL